MRPRSDSAIKVSVVRVISTSTPRARRTVATFFATESTTSFSRNQAGVPIGPVIPLSGPPCPASMTTILRDAGFGRAGRGTDPVDGAVELAVRGGGSGEPFDCGVVTV